MAPFDAISPESFQPVLGRDLFLAEDGTSVLSTRKQQERCKQILWLKQINARALQSFYLQRTEALTMDAKLNFPTHLLFRCGGSEIYFHIA